jgi:hypothetical protein
MTRAVLLLSLLAGCAAAPPVVVTPPPRLPPIDTVVWSEDLAKHVDEWEAEIAADPRFARGAHVLICHGGELAGRFVLGPDGGPKLDATQAAWILRHMHGDGLPIVVVSCNPGGHKINVSRVFYARALVYTPPGNTPKSPTTQPWVSRVRSFEEGESPLFYWP